MPKAPASGTSAPTRPTRNISTPTVATGARTSPTKVGVSVNSPTSYATERTPTSPTLYAVGASENTNGSFGGFRPAPCVGVYHNTYVDLYSCT